MGPLPKKGKPASKERPSEKWMRELSSVGADLSGYPHRYIYSQRTPTTHHSTSHRIYYYNLHTPVKIYHNTTQIYNDGILWSSGWPQRPLKNIGIQQDV